MKLLHSVLVSAATEWLVLMIYSIICFSACWRLCASSFLSTTVDADATPFWKRVYSLPLEMEEKVVGKYSFLVCRYVWEYDGGRHHEDRGHDSLKVHCAAYLV